MKRTLNLLIAAAFSFTVFSCQKEITDTTTNTGTDSTGTGNGASIIGTWKFISLEAKTSSTVQVFSGPNITKTVTTSSYITENNTGMLTFSAATATADNISYSVNSVAKGFLYENGVLIDSFSSPFQSNIPPASSSAPYKRINADSLYFQSGFSFMGNTPQGTQTQPGGTKIKLEQNMLYLNQSVDQTSTQVVQGETVTSIIAATTKMSFQKQ